MLSFPASLALMDMDSGGALLMATGGIRREMMVRGPGQTVEMDLSWLDWSTPTILSPDGKMVFFEEGNDSTVDGYSIHMRHTDGSPPLHLGFGSILALSPDQSRIAIVKRPFQAENQELVLLPIGPGSQQTVPKGDLEILFTFGHWLAATDEGGPEALMTCEGGATACPGFITYPSTEMVPRAR